MTLWEGKILARCKMLFSFLRSCHQKIYFYRNDSTDIKVNPLRVFADEKSTSGRGISCLGISPHFSELVIASYHNPEEYSTEPGGLASLWNLRFKKSTPEDIFRCHSALTAVSFADFHPNLLIGGTYSGQIVVWDNRVNKRTPINKSQVAVSTHCVSQRCHP